MNYYMKRRLGNFKKTISRNDDLTCWGFEIGPGGLCSYSEIVERLLPPEEGHLYKYICMEIDLDQDLETSTTEFQASEGFRVWKEKCDDWTSQIKNGDWDFEVRAGFRRQKEKEEGNKNQL